MKSKKKKSSDGSRSLKVHKLSLTGCKIPGGSVCILELKSVREALLPALAEHSLVKEVIITF